MGSRMVEMVLALVLLTALCAGTLAQSGCTSVLIGMAPCLNYVTGSSTTPSSSCCSSLASVVKSQPQCLCSALNGGGAALGISINETLALALPAACKVQTPPVSRCNAANNAPAPAPVGLSPMVPSPVAPAPVGPSPVGTPESSQADTPTGSMSGSGSNTVPENGSSSSNATGSNTVPENGASSDATNTGSKTVPGNSPSSGATSTKTIRHHLAAGFLIVAFVSAINGV